MGFPDHNFDLHGTPFTQKDLEFARSYWKFLIEHVTPTWLDDPSGALAIHWTSNTVPSAVRLIDTAKMLFALAHSITEDSQSVFGTKLQQLLNLNGVQHKEHFTELMVGALLTGLGKPISMEPVSLVSPTVGATPTSVDYCVEWTIDGSKVFIESTVFHIQRLIDWESAVNDLKRRFEQAVVAKNINCALQITAPLSLTRKTVSIAELAKALRIIAKSPRGSHLVRLCDDDLLLEWAPAAHLDTWPAGGIQDVPGFAFTSSSGVMIGTVAATSVRLKWPGDAENLVIRSLRNTLDTKREQFQLPSPYLLIIRLLNNRIPYEGVIDLLIRRIFENQRYRWISSVGIWDMRFSQNTSYQTRFTLIQNPQADYCLPDSFVATLIPRDASET